jgi:hypothetical protein
MTRSTTRIAGIGAGALLALGFFTAVPAGAADGTQADAHVQVETGDAINQTLDLVNQACTDLSQAGNTAASALATEHGITVASQSSAGVLNLQVSLPALTDSLSSLGDLPLLGSVAGEVDATEPLQISCAASANGTGLGLTAAGVDVLVDAIAPGVDVSGLDLDIPAVDASASANVSGAAVPTNTSVSVNAAGSLPAAQAKVAPSARVSAAAPGATTTTTAAADAAPATASGSPSVSGGTLARTGAGLGGLGLLGGVLIGGGRLLAFGRKFLGIG